LKLLSLHHLTPPRRPAPTDTDTDSGTGTKNDTDVGVGVGVGYLDPFVLALMGEEREEVANR